MEWEREEISFWCRKFLSANTTIGIEIDMVGFENAVKVTF